MPDETRQITYTQAVREALDTCLAQSEDVIVIGEGVPDPKAIFGTTAGLAQKYGPKRVFDMPLAENGMTGVCIGAAMTGMRPVLVHQRIDFSLLAMDQIVNNAAKWHYMFDGKANVPLVVRMIIGRGWGQGPQHSQSLQSMFGQVPGLKVIMPATPYDAKGMLISAIEDDNPVIFIEHRWLQQIEDYVPESDYRVSLDEARLLCEGDAVTVAAFSYAAMESFSAAKALAATMGIHVDVLDMRVVRPLDIDSVVRSVTKTGRLIVVDTALYTGSIAGEVIAQVMERAFVVMKSAPVRVALPDYPVPTSHFMTEDWYPGPRGVAEAVIDLVAADRDTEEYAALCAALQQQGRHDAPSNDFTGPF
jgi:pyruvate/2-oxoglutarate/acetoin dehydrogenase E1 component